LFVTFWNKEKLRGCVGAVTSTDDVCDMIQHVTRSSLIDPRFRDDPIEATELPRLTIEVSLISEPVRTKDPAGLICGVHGVIVRRGDRSGCFLPKVAVERCWSAEQFLSNCCTMKAGLPPGAWRQPETEVLLFTADSFREPENA
jgi:AmmeMemoRadiSam system protein A